MAHSSPRPNSPNRSLRVGSHIKVRRSTYYHHGIYVGRGQVIHYAGLSTKRTKDGPIALTTLEEFADKSRIQVVDYEEPLPKDKIVANAKSRIGESSYDLVRNNCEHFATWCVTGKSQSKQVRVFVLGGIISLQLHNLIEW